jgi:hypothetical protein
MKRLTLWLSFLPFVFPPAAFAQVKANPVVDIGQIVQGMGGKVSQLGTIGAFISALLPYIYGFAGIALFLLLIKGGFSMLTSAGDPKKTESAKGELTAAIVGFLIVITAFWITQIMATVFNLQYKGTNFF